MEGSGVQVLFEGLCATCGQESEEPPEKPSEDGDGSTGAAADARSFPFADAAVAHLTRILFLLQ